MTANISRPRAATAALTPTLAALLTLAALGACKNKGAQANDSVAARATVGVENVAVARLDLVQVGPTIQGTLEPEESAAVRAQVSGAVLSTHAEAGQRVAAGALLAQLDEAGLRSSVISAQSAVATAEANQRIAQREVERAQTLVTAGAIAERNLEQARNAASAAASQLASARAQLTAVREQLSKTRVTAPISGVVSQRSVNAGDVVQPGMALFTIVDPSSMRLVASVPAEQLTAVRLGIPVTFSVNGYPDRRFVGRVTRINPTVDPATRQVQITVSIPNVGSTLVGGLFAQGKAATESRTAPVVPVKAVDDRSGRPQVVRVKGGVTQRVDVVVGLRDEDLGIVEIRSGVVAGDTVLVGAAMGLSAGTPVQIQRNPNDRGTGTLPSGASTAAQHP